MKTVSNDCGTRNNFGFYDVRAKEIVLTRPCSRKSDINEAYDWLDNAENLRKFAIGIGGVESFVTDDAGNGLYTAARSTIKQEVLRNAAGDNLVLSKFLKKLEGKNELRNLSLRCFVFSDDAELFALMMQTIKTLPSLVYLDLAGCYFTDSQLIELARMIATTHIANLVWPEPRMSPMVEGQVVGGLSASRALVVGSCVPAEVSKILERNRQWVFNMAKYPTRISEDEIAVMKEYRDTFRFAVAYEKQRLLELEKTIEAFLA